MHLPFSPIKEYPLIKKKKVFVLVTDHFHSSFRLQSIINKFCNLLISLLGQLCVLHEAVPVVFPVQGIPPFLASVSTFRTPCLIPPPHGLVHLAHVPQFPDRQSTNDTKISQTFLEKVRGRVIHNFRDSKD